MPETRGALIVIEGLDRSGKTTQTARLLAHLESLSVPVKLQRFPGIDDLVCRDDECPVKLSGFE